MDLRTNCFPRTKPVGTASAVVSAVSRAPRSQYRPPKEQAGRQAGRMGVADVDKSSRSNANLMQVTHLARTIPIVNFEEELMEAKARYTHPHRQDEPRNCLVHESAAY